MVQVELSEEQITEIIEAIEFVEQAAPLVGEQTGMDISDSISDLIAIKEVLQSVVLPAALEGANPTITI